MQNAGCGSGSRFPLLFRFQTPSRTAAISVYSRKLHLIRARATNDRMMAATAGLVRNSHAFSDARFSCQEVTRFFGIEPNMPTTLKWLERQPIFPTSFWNHAISTDRQEWRNPRRGHFPSFFLA